MMKIFSFVLAFISLTTYCEGMQAPIDLGKLLSLGSSITGKSNQLGSCAMNSETIMKDVAICMEHDYALAFEIGIHMNDFKGMESMDFLCGHRSSIAKLLDCLEHKLVNCLPSPQKDIVQKILPTQHGLEEGFNLLCNETNQKILSSNCFEDQMTPFMNCYIGKLGHLNPSTVASFQDPKTIVCSVIRMEERCVSENKGSCSTKFIGLIIELLEKVFPMENCKGLEEVMNKLLVHGAPYQGQSLRFQSMKNGPTYKVQGN